MKVNAYRVVLSGEVAEGASVDDVVGRLAVLFKTTESMINRLFKRGNPVVKQDVDRETADRYQRAIEKTGALCRVEPMNSPLSRPSGKSAPAAPPASPAPPAEEDSAPDRKGPNVVPVELVYRTEERFKPHFMKRISGTSTSIILDASDRSEVPFDRIAAVAAYSDQNHIPQLLVFIKKDTHPATCKVDNIDFSKFPVKELPKPHATFRNFIHFLCRQYPSIIIDETTLDFLSGSPLPAMDEIKVERFSTAMGKVIESGERG